MGGCVPPPERPAADGPPVIIGLGLPTGVPVAPLAVAPPPAGEALPRPPPAWPTDLGAPDGPVSRDEPADTGFAKPGARGGADTFTGPGPLLTVGAGAVVVIAVGAVGVATLLISVDVLLSSTGFGPRVSTGV